MGFFRDGRLVPTDGADAIFDSPQVRRAREEVSRLYELARTDSGEAFVWIGLFGPTKAELALVSDVFALPRHQIEDAGNSHQRPKVDIDSDQSFVVLKVLSYVEETRQVETGQVAVFVAPDFVVTIRHGSTHGLRRVRDHVVARQPLVDGPVGLLHAIVDDVVDGYLVVAGQVADEVERLEETVFSPRQRDLSESIYLLKRENLEVRRAVTPLIGVASDLASEAVGEVPSAMVAGFRDVGEHMLRVADHAESIDALLLALMAASNAKATLQQSDDQRRIAAWAALALVPTVLFSLYGMNFTYMPELTWRWGYPAVLLLAGGIITLLYRRFRRVGWL